VFDGIPGIAANIADEKGPYSRLRVLCHALRLSTVLLTQDDHKWMITRVGCDSPSLFIIDRTTTVNRAAATNGLD
jgi:hypothetical protein